MKWCKKKKVIKISEKIKPKNKKSSGGYKGYAPFKSDLTIGWFLKMLLQVVILWAIYLFYIDGVRAQYGTDNFIVDFLIEIPFVLAWMIISDICASSVAWIIVALYNYFNDYMKREKTKKQFTRRVSQYFIYTIIRAIIYSLGLVVLISAALYPFTQVGPINFSILLAWILISTISKGIAWSIALKLSI